MALHYFSVSLCLASCSCVSFCPSLFFIQPILLSLYKYPPAPKHKYVSVLLAARGRS